MDINILTDDNVELRATLYKANNPKAVVLINPGTATKTSYYLPFAKYLREHGFHVILWNYRGFCDSKTSHLKECHYQYSDIGRYDIPAAIDTAKRLFNDLPLLSTKLSP